jgi:PAS domain S-box-containing protein
VSLAGWITRFSRRLGGPRVLALPLLRALALLSGWTWILLAPSETRPLVWTMVGFTAYSALIFVALRRWPAATLTLHAPVLVCDLGFALAMIAFSGGAHSTLFLALLLIAGLQSYYHGLRQGIVVAVIAAVGYLIVAWNTTEGVGWANMMIRFLVLIGTAVGVGLIGELEQAERTDAYRLRQSAAERELFIRDVVDSLGEGVIVLDDDYRIVLVNAAVEARHGIVGSEVVGRNVFTVFRKWDSSQLRSEIDRLLRGAGKSFRIPGVEHDSADGHRIIVDIGGSVFRRRGRPAGVVFVGQDVTERVGLEQSARRAEKLAALGTLAAGLAHELNNPIGIISSRIEVMLMEAESRQLPPVLLEDLRVLHRHAMRVARIARGFLSFARPGPGGQGPVDLNHVVDETLLLAEKQISRSGITIRRMLAAGLPPIRGDAGTLQQVVLNLVTNASDAISGAGEIRIETRAVHQPAGAVQLIVADTGAGIAPEAIPKIFDPFYTTKSEGTGLGLSVSHGIVRDHGGTIDVESRPGIGTTFVLTFPAAAEEQRT